MRAFFVSLALLLAALLAGCATDLRGPSPICQVHHKMMRTVFVHGAGMSLDAGGRYEPAHRSLFPNVYPTYMPMKMLIFYVCDDCIKSQREWFESHK
jgi:hypothetical protein